MNFLAHLYLTKDRPDKVVIGNFIADAVKGKKAMLSYDEEVQLGMRIHREIDDFTDKHILFQKGTKRLHGTYGKYAGVIMDIYYDHILASNWNEYSDKPLQSFANSQYRLIEDNIALLPDRTMMWFSYMRHNNLLYNYSKLEDIDLVFRRMDQRFGGVSGMRTAVNELKLFINEYATEFKEFFEDMQVHLQKKFFTHS